MPRAGSYSPKTTPRPAFEGSLEHVAERRNGPILGEPDRQTGQNPGEEDPLAGGEPGLPVDGDWGRRTDPNQGEPELFAEQEHEPRGADEHELAVVEREPRVGEVDQSRRAVVPPSASGPPKTSTARSSALDEPSSALVDRLSGTVGPQAEIQRQKVGLLSDHG